MSSPCCMGVVLIARPCRSLWWLDRCRDDLIVLSRACSIGWVSSVHIVDIRMDILMHALVHIGVGHAGMRHATVIVGGPSAHGVFLLHGFDWGSVRLTMLLRVLDRARLMSLKLVLTVVCMLSRL